MNTKINTTGWAHFPFSIKGVNFVSKIDKTGSMYPQIIVLPEEIWVAMNTSAIVELLGNPSELTIEELQEKLNYLNQGASEALIELAGQN